MLDADAATCRPFGGPSIQFIAENGRFTVGVPRVSSLVGIKYPRTRPRGGPRGRPRWALPRQCKEEPMASETYEGEFYCVKCKAKRTAKGDVVVNEKGTRMAKGKCPECGTNLNRILGKA